MPKINWAKLGSILNPIAFLFLVALAIVMLACPKVVSGQQVISAKAGLLHYFEGDVYTSERKESGHAEKIKVSQSRTEFVQLEVNQLFSTEVGRAEIFLLPGCS